MSDSDDIVRKLCEIFLKREASPEDLAAWAERSGSLSTVAGVIDAFAKSEEHRRIVGT